MPRSKTPKRSTSVTPNSKPHSNTPHPKNVGRLTKVSNLTIKIPNGTPEPKACSICAISRKSRKGSKGRKCRKSRKAF